MLKYNEWLITNKKGSYASSSSVFANLRTYHGLCVKRDQNYEGKVLLSKLYEEFEIDGKSYSIDTNYYLDAIYPEGFKHLIDFNQDQFPWFEFNVADSLITKSLVMDPDKDWLVIRYDFIGRLPDKIYLHPLFAFRSYHLALRKREMNVETFQSENGYSFRTGDDFVNIYVKGNFIKDNTWFYNFLYPIDRERGSNCVEDLYHEGYFVIKPKENFLEIKISCEEAEPLSFEAIKRRMLSNKSSFKGELNSVAKASTSFLLYDDIIAGFYWFGPWTRDTMISLPGLLLVTKRFKIAKNILEKYSRLAEKGILPVSLTDPNNIASADSSLWFIYAIYKYYIYTGDKNTLKKVLPSAVSVLNAYIKGNDFFEMKGSLIFVKKPQLTWMDARTGNTIFTPRTGMPVEVNALWYNALASLDYFSKELNINIPDYVRTLQQKVKEEFIQKFVKGNKVLDTVEPEDDSLRPNFILAFSLPFPVLDSFSGFKKAVDDKLLTPFGLRSLSPDDPKYIGKYEGDQYQRDRAYHNGSVWPWLAGPYITASVRSGNDKDILYEYFKPLIKMKMIPEIFDGDEPHMPRGCIMQAWSYGEILRAYAEDLV